MKTLLRILVTAAVVMFLILNSVAVAGNPANGSARAALALSSAAAKAKAEAKGVCACGAKCDCKNGECGDANCPSLKVSSPGPLEWAVYLAQYNRALSANKPLLIWVGETCPACESAWSEYVHARLSDYHDETGPEVIVAKPDGLGGMSVVGRLDGIPKKDQVTGLIQGVQSRAVTPAAPPVFQPTPMMLMMGGFGGGCAGGCCGSR